MRVFFKAIRVHQWVKNLLLFVPLVMAHEQGNVQLLLKTSIAFFSFCLCASSVYLLNDILDLEADRQHAKKRFRPLASGQMAITTAMTLIPLFLVLSGIITLWLPTDFLYVLALYFVITLAYSFLLKQLVLVDIITLAMLYTIRILAGGHAAGVVVSQWLLTFSMFFFVSLACVKRFAELWALRKDNRESAAGRGYGVRDLEQVAQLGSACGSISVLVMALYISGKDVSKLYSSPDRLWLICPLLLYWISRVWLLAYRGELDEDPIVFALSDRTSYVVGLLAALIMFAAI